ncbi:MAG TPA: GNAT family N-acetyltransferase, partial [Nitrospirota bacterium]
LKKELDDVQLIHFITTGAIRNDETGPKTRFKHRSFFVGSDTREVMKQGQADYIPISIAEVPHLIKTGRIVFDLALIQVSEPDEFGYVSLGVSVDITRAAARHAKTLIAEINPKMPRTLGDTFLHIGEIDSLVQSGEPIIEYTHQPAVGTAERIARYVARLVEDGSTLQVGLGQIPNEMLRHLTNRRNLGIHSDVITDPIVDLIEKGVITGRHKTVHQGQVVASYCLGNRRLYDLIDRNPMFSFHPIEYVCDPAVIAKNHRMVSVSQAFAVDLTGQVCADQFQGEFYSGVSTQMDFLRSVARCEGGKAIICLASTTADGKTSRIRPLLLQGEGVTIPRSDVQYVVTEYGMAYLYGRSIRDRALSLIEISHPDFRESLLEEAKRLGYVRKEQQLRSKMAYPAEEEREVTLKNGKQLLVRPSRASDVQGLQDIFYRLPPHDIYTRFMSGLKSLPVSEAEHLCNVDYENEMAFVAVTGERSEETIVGSSCYFLDPTTNLAETAFMVLPEWQGTGLGTQLQSVMADYARRKGIRGFFADILPENIKMKKLAQSLPNASIKNLGDVFEVTVLF